MSEKHTPGPWVIGFHDGTGSGAEEDSGAYVTVPTHPTTSDAETILVVRGGTNDWGGAVGVVGRTQAEKEANARLIAAAPDLLEALNKITDQMDRNRGRCDVATYNLACDAIEKAEGEAE